MLVTNKTFSLSCNQASALEERLQKTETKLKKSREEAQDKIQQLNDANSQLWMYILAGIFGLIAFIAAFVFDLIQLHPGGRTSGLWS